MSIAAIYVTSDEQVAIHTATYYPDLYNVIAPDSTLARPITEMSLEHVLVSHHNVDHTFRWVSQLAFKPVSVPLRKG